MYEKFGSPFASPRFFIVKFRKKLRSPWDDWPWDFLRGLQSAASNRWENLRTKKGIYLGKLDKALLLEAKGAVICDGRDKNFSSTGLSLYSIIPLVLLWCYHAGALHRDGVGEYLFDDLDEGDLQSDIEKRKKQLEGEKQTHRDPSKSKCFLP